MQKAHIDTTIIYNMGTVSSKTFTQILVVGLDLLIQNSLEVRGCLCLTQRARNQAGSARRAHATLLEVTQLQCSETVMSSQHRAASFSEDTVR